MIRKFIYVNFIHICNYIIKVMMQEGTFVSKKQEKCWATMMEKIIFILSLRL